MSNLVLIFVAETSPRLQYVFDIIWKDVLGVEYTLTHDATLFRNHEGAKFSYSKTPVSDEVFQEIGNTLLFERGLKPQSINIIEWGELKGLYATSNPQSILPFDFVATAFFFITRYEEYLAHRTDKHGRFRASSCMQVKGDFLSKPMVNYYALYLQKKMLERYPDLQFQKLPYSFLNTFDIDIAYAYKHKSLIRNLGGFARSALLSNFEDVTSRFLTLTRGRKDPYDTCDYILRICEKNSAPSKFFFLLADEGKFDKNTAVDVSEFRKLVKKISGQTTTGIHLSYASHEAQSIAAKEINRLRDMTEDKVISNRFHYLKLHYPSSYQRLIKLGIEEDYSMGFASRIGFRMSITIPVYFFDLKDNKQTTLKLFPISYMDATLNHYYKLKPQQAEQRILKLIEEVRKTGGLFMALWHNSSLSEARPWKGWRRVFENVTEAAAKP